MSIISQMPAGPLIVLGEIWRHLSPRRKAQTFLLSVLMLLGGLAEAISLGLVVPFLAVMAAPAKILDHKFTQSLLLFLNETGIQLGIEIKKLQSDSRTLLLILACSFIGAALFTGAVRLALVWVSVRLTGAIGTDLGLEAYRRTLYQPYSVHVARNSSTLISTLTSKISVLTATYGSWSTLITSSVIILFLLIALLIVNFRVTVVAGGIIGIAYMIMTLVSKRELVIHSGVISREHSLMVKFLQEGLGGIRDILLDGTQDLYSELYRKADGLYRRAKAEVSIIGHSPRYIMETVGLVIFAVLALVLSKGPDGLALALPTLGAFALGVQRMLPALQQGYQAWSNILGCQKSNQEVVELLNQPLPRRITLPPPAPMHFRNEICFKDVRFHYSPQSPWVLDGLSFTITKGSRVGFVGKTGSGKSTCLDLLMGLLEPTKGQVVIDGAPLTPENLRAWQRNIAHVPQAIFLSDSSLAENIAFGIPVEKIDMSRVRKAARQAQIADFIESSPDGYQTFVGERGIRLSGGQRQRIGIARALYKQAEVLVFDEATSALDRETEGAVMRSIESLRSDLTILIIAHRTSTLKNCNEIVDLDFIHKSQQNNSSPLD